MRSFRVSQTTLWALVGVTFSVLLTAQTQTIRAKHPEDAAKSRSRGSVSLSPSPLTKLWNHVIWDLSDWSQIVRELGIDCLTAFEPTERVAHSIYIYEFAAEDLSWIDELTGQR